MAAGILSAASTSATVAPSAKVNSSDAEPTGAGYTPEEVETIGERIFNAERLYLLAAGFTRKDDSLPRRITHEPMPLGPAKGMVCRLEEMLGPYYALRGWSPEGVPTKGKIADLGLL